MPKQAMTNGTPVSRVHSKRCSKCKKLKLTTDFPRRLDTQRGIAGVCKSCKNEAARKLYGPKYAERTAKQKRERRQYQREYMRDYGNRPEYREYVKSRRVTHWLTVLVQSAKSRAKKAGIAFDLDDVWVEANSSVTQCALTGLMLRPGAPAVRKAPNPLVPSLDRIIPEKGYTKGNVRIVCHWANMAKSTMTDDELRMFVFAAARHMRH